MALVTIEGSRVLRNTFLAPGAKITVERTPLIHKMIMNGFVNLIREHEPAVVETAAPVVDEPEDADPFGPPPESASKAVWKEYLAAKITPPSDATKAEMIEAWKAHGRP